MPSRRAARWWALLSVAAQDALAASLTEPSLALLDGEEDTGPAVVASAVALVLEGLHLSKRLNKHTAGPRSRYQART